MKTWNQFHLLVNVILFMMLRVKSDFGSEYCHTSFSKDSASEEAQLFFQGRSNHGQWIQILCHYCHFTTINQKQIRDGCR